MRLAVNIPAQPKALVRLPGSVAAWAPMSGSQAPQSEPGVIEESVVSIGSAADIVTARERGRTMATALGFTGSDLTVIATAISELARNIIEYATSGTIALVRVDRGGQAGIVIVARDEGPGIPDLARALSAGYSSAQGLGLGLPGVRRMMDEFEVSSLPGEGTTVTVRKWLP